MHEHVLATALRLNEAVSFCWIEPFNSTSSHSTLHRICPVRLPGAATYHRERAVVDVRFWPIADIPMWHLMSLSGVKRNGSLRRICPLLTQSGHSKVL